MKVYVCYALPQQQFLEELEMPEGCTAREAIMASKVLEEYPEIDLATAKVGVYAKLIQLDAGLSEYDRVEIYRSLPGKPRDAHAVDDKKARIRARKEQRKEAPGSE